MRTEKIVVISIKVYQFLLRKGKASTLGTRHTGGPSCLNPVEHLKEPLLQPGAIRRNFSQTAKKSFK
jgi:hypothetical protein